MIWYLRIRIEFTVLSGIGIFLSRFFSIRYHWSYYHSVVSNFYRHFHVSIIWFEIMCILINCGHRIFLTMFYQTPNRREWKRSAKTQLMICRYSYKMRMDNYFPLKRHDIFFCVYRRILAREDLSKIGLENEKLSRYRSPF